MRRLLAFSLVLALASACGGGTEPVNYGPPSLLLVNGVTKPSGSTGMTVILEGDGLAEAKYGKVFFLGGGAVAVQAQTSDWTNEYILATVPAGISAASKVWVETDWGTTDSLDFALISGATFSPSNISWARTTSLPQPLQGLGAVFVPIETEDVSAKYIFTLGGAADQTNAATTHVYRGSVLETGAISEWTAATALPAPRAYHASAVATPYTSRMDTTGAAYLYVIGGVDAAGTVVGTVQYAPVALDGTVGGWLATTALPTPLRSATAVLYRGYLYVVGGADATGAPRAETYRAEVNPDGTLGVWQNMPALPAGVAHQGMTNFGPFLYVLGGETQAASPWTTTSASETNASYFARIDLVDGTVAEWTTLTSGLNKARTRHGVMTAGGSVVVTSGMYSGQAGSSENSYSNIDPATGQLTSWNGATGGSTILDILGYSLYNPAAVSFADATGMAHVIVLGGANRATGRASSAVVFY